MMNEYTVSAHVDTTEIDEAMEKIIRFVELLTEANELLNKLTSVDVSVTLDGDK